MWKRVFRSFRGLPFMIGGLAGGIGGSSFIAPSPSGGSVFVPVGKAAKRVLFAHALLETKLDQGGRLGEPVAEYVFYLSNGRQERVNIRERFEIAASPSYPPGTPGPPYRAVTDSKATLMPRYEGEFDAAGKRQTEANQATAELCWLWSWENPEPDSSIETIEIVPAGMRFFIAAITLGHIDEHPFPREGRRPAKITLLDDADASKPFDVDVEVDRGDATYVFPLPAVSSDEFLDAPYSWGQDDNESSSPSYVEISATPSATVTIKQGDSEVGKAAWGDVVSDGGSVETEKVKIELIDPGKNWVHVTVVDDETGRIPYPVASTSGRPTACRTSRTVTTTRSTPTSERGTTTWAAICVLDRRHSPTSTARARGGCRAERSSWTCLAASSTSRCGRRSLSSRASASWSCVSSDGRT